MSEQKCLTLFDVTGIQEFVFAPNKLKENIGGSIYVQQIFEKGLTECIGDENSIIDWENQRELQILHNNSVKAEVVYIGGGNALVVFDSRQTAVETTKKLSAKLLEETLATLGVVVAHLETDLKDFNEDRKQLFRSLQVNKDKFINSSPLRGIAITEECSDGLPSEGKKEEDNFVSKVASKKIEIAKSDNQFDDLLPDGYLFPKEFDDLGQIEGENHLAVVHIDGNSIGRFIDKKLENISNYSDAIPIIRDISKKLKGLYKTIFREMISNVTETLKDKDIPEKIKLKDDKEKKLPLLPLRPIILNGDDVTFVCDGRVGIQLANHFLKLLSNQELQLESGDEKLSACAGVAIVKSHFPFYRAYLLAEELCSSAKKKAKAKAKALNNKNPGSWIDYHIVYSGFQLDLDAMRKEQYNIPGMDAVSSDVDYPQYNLLLRPFCVTGESDSDYQWEKMKNLYLTLNKKIPRSRLKNLRNGFISSKEEVEQIVLQNESRGYNLLPFKIRKGINDCSTTNIFEENQTPYFEPLELLDYYIPEFNLEQEDN